MENLRERVATLAVIPGTTFNKYLYGLFGFLQEKGVVIEVISTFRFHLVEARQTGVSTINSDLRSLFAMNADLSISDDEIDRQTMAFRKMFRFKPSYRTLFRKLVPWYRQFFQKGDVDALLVFNGSKIYQRAAVCAAEREGIKIIYLENGYLPRTMQVDPRGINYRNSLVDRYLLKRDSVCPCSYDELANHARRSICRDEIPEEGKVSLRKGIKWCWSAGMDLVVDPILRPWLWRPAISGYLRAKRLASATIPPLGGELPPRYLLLILQVECDTQHVLHSPLFQSMREAIRICAEARDEVAPDLSIVVRPHPAEARPWQALEKLDALTNISWDETTSLEEALDKAEIVCTINSSVGFQALMAGKRVFALGEACYTLPLVCPGAVEFGSAAAALRAAMVLDVNNPERMKFLTYAAKEYFVYDSWTHLTRGGLENTASRIHRELVGTPSVAEPGQGSEIV